MKLCLVELSVGALWGLAETYVENPDNDTVVFATRTYGLNEDRPRSALPIQNNEPFLRNTKMIAAQVRVLAEYCDDLDDLDLVTVQAMVDPNDMNAPAINVGVSYTHPLCEKTGQLERLVEQMRSRKGVPRVMSPTITKSLVWTRTESRSPATAPVATWQLL